MTPLPIIRRPSGFGRLEPAFLRSKEGESLPPTPLHGIPPGRLVVPLGPSWVIFRSKWPSGAASKFGTNFHSIFDRFGSRFGAILEAKLGPKSGSRGPFFRLGMHFGAEACKKPISKPSSKVPGSKKCEKHIGFCIFLLILHYAFRAPSEALWASLGGHFRDPKRL